MKEFPKGGLIGKAVRLYRQVAALRIPLYAANASYFMVLALFPALLLLVSALRRTSLDPARLTQLFSGILPAAFLDEVQTLIQATYGASHSAFLSISALTALWAASRGIYGVLTGLNAIYGVTESRGYLHTRLISTLYTLVFLGVLLLTLMLQVFAGGLITFVQQIFPPFLRFLIRLFSLRFFLLLFLQTSVFTLMFMVLPNQRNGFRSSLPGALLASCGWLVFTDLFSIYVSFSAHSGLYGSLSALALGMLWLYCCMSIVFYGGALNVILKKWR